MYPHVHKYRFESKVTNKHKHRLIGCTDSMIGIDSFHIHTFFGICSYNGHTHYYSGFSSLPIKTEFGHIHKIEGKLETNLMHDHVFRSYTDEEIEYISRTILRKVYI